MADATFAHGTVFTLGGTTISESINVTGPNISIDMLDVTHHQSPNAYREFIKGLRDPGEISIEGNMIFSSYNTLNTQVNTASTAAAVLTVPTAPSVTQWEADVHIQDLSLETPVDDVASFSATLKITGKPTLSQI